MTLLLSLRRRAPSGLATDSHPLRGGEETTMYDFLHTTFFGFMYLRPRERDTPEHVPAAVKFDPAVEIRTARVLFSYFVQLGSFFLPFKARPTLALINLPLYCIPAINLFTVVSYPHCSRSHTDLLSTAKQMSYFICVTRRCADHHQVIEHLHSNPVAVWVVLHS